MIVYIEIQSTKTHIDYAGKYIMNRCLGVAKNIQYLEMGISVKKVMKLIDIPTRQGKKPNPNSSFLLFQQPRQISPAIIPKLT